jgi:hypothetical protein
VAQGGEKPAETHFTIKTHTSDENCMHNTLTLGAENLTTVDVQSDAEKA